MFHASWMRPVGAPEAQAQSVSILCTVRAETKAEFKWVTNERRQVGAGSNLKNAVGIDRHPTPAPGKPCATDHLEQHQTDQDGFDHG